MSDVRSCADCGQPLEEGWQACPNCGRLVGDASRSKRNLALGLGALTGGLALVVVGVLLATHTKTTVVRRPTARPSALTNAATATATAPGVARPAAPSHLGGTGPGSSAPFTVTSGLAVFSGTCACTKSFSASLIDAGGRTQGVILSSAAGRFTGSFGKLVHAGAYTLKVGADGPWSVDVSQPRNQPPKSLPQTFSGQGTMFVGPFAATGSVKLTANNAGSGTFIVEILGPEGAVRATPFTKVGKFSASAVASGLTSGPFYMNVHSDGTWSVVVAKS